MKYFLPLLIVCSIARSASAQYSKQDYLITAKNDTLHGRLQLNSSRNGTVRLHRTGLGHSDFGPAETKHYGSSKGVIRVSNIVGPDGKPQFMTPLVEGYVNLYSGENEDKDKRYYLQVAGAIYVTEIAPKTSQLTLARSLPGCPALVFGTDEIHRQYPYSADGMTRLIMAYNTCLKPSQPGLALKRVGTLDASFGLKAGVSVPAFTIIAPAYAGFGPQRDTKGYQAGLALNIRLVATPDFAEFRG